MSKYNLLDIVDMQNSFLSEKGVLSIENGEFLINKVSDFINQLNKINHNIDIALIKQDTHFLEEYKNSSEAALFPIHCEYNTTDWELAIPIIKANTATYFMFKNKFDMWDNDLNKNKKFYEKLFNILNEKSEIIYESIEDLLHLYNNRNTTVYLFGVASDFCVKDAICGYLIRGYEVRVITDFTLGINSDIFKTSNLYFSEYLANNKLKLIKSQDLINLLYK